MKMFPNGATAQDMRAIQAGVLHFQGKDHDESVCPACQIRADHKKWIKDNV